MIMYSVCNKFMECNSSCGEKKFCKHITERPEYLQKLFNNPKNLPGCKYNRKVHWLFITDFQFKMYQVVYPDKIKVI